MGESGEAGMSISNYSNQVVRQNTFKESIRGEREPNYDNFVSRSGCSSPSLSSWLKLTDLVARIDSETPIESEDTVNGYQVKKEFMPTLKKIIDDHGDIAKECTKESVEYRSALLQLICGIILELKMKNLIETEEGILKRNFCIVDVIRNKNVEVDWLYKRITAALEAKKTLTQFGTL